MSRTQWPGGSKHDGEIDISCDDIGLYREAGLVGGVGPDDHPPAGFCHKRTENRGKFGWQHRRARRRHSTVLVFRSPGSGGGGDVIDSWRQPLSLAHWALRLPLHVDFSNSVLISWSVIHQCWNLFVIAWTYFGWRFWRNYLLLPSWIKLSYKTIIT